MRRNTDGVGIMSFPNLTELRMSALQGFIWRAIDESVMFLIQETINLFDQLHKFFWILPN